MAIFTVVCDKSIRKAAQDGAEGPVMIAREQQESAQTMATYRNTLDSP